VVRAVVRVPVLAVMSLQGAGSAGCTQGAAGPTLGGLRDLSEQAEASAGLVPLPRIRRDRTVMQPLADGM